MKNHLVFVFIGISLASSTLSAEPPTRRLPALLPADARIIESANLSLPGAKKRSFVLWMKAPQKVMAQWDSAADFLYGDHWYGPTFLSLIDAANFGLVNTIQIRPGPESPVGPDEFAIPFFTNAGRYTVPRPNRDHRGKPVLMRLRDLTGKGVAGQFVLFDHIASGIAATSVLGYSSQLDRAVQYSVERTYYHFQPVIELWAEQVFGRKPVRPGYWKFTWEAGHGSEEWIDEEVRFDAVRQLFIEKVKTRPYPGSASLYCSLTQASLGDFLSVMQTFIGDGQIEWLQGLIREAKPNKIGTAVMVPKFDGSIALSFQVSEGGVIRIQIDTESQFAAALEKQLGPGCVAK